MLSYPITTARAEIPGNQSKKEVLMNPELKVFLLTLKLSEGQINQLHEELGLEELEQLEDVQLDHLIAVGMKAIPAVTALRKMKEKLHPEMAKPATPAPAPVVAPQGPMMLTMAPTPTPIREMETEQVVALLDDPTKSGEALKELNRRDVADLQFLVVSGEGKDRKVLVPESLELLEARSNPDYFGEHPVYSPKQLNEGSEKTLEASPLDPKQRLVGGRDRTNNDWRPLSQVLRLTMMLLFRENLDESIFPSDGRILRQVDALRTRAQALDVVEVIRTLATDPKQAPSSVREAITLVESFGDSLRAKLAEGLVFKTSEHTTHPMGSLASPTQPGQQEIACTLNRGFDNRERARIIFYALQAGLTERRNQLFVEIEDIKAGMSTPRGPDTFDLMVNDIETLNYWVDRTPKGLRFWLRNAKNLTKGTPYHEKFVAYERAWIRATGGG